MKARLHIHNEMESELVLIGGGDRTELLAAVRQLADYIRRAPFPVLRDIALTTGTAAREAFCRAAVVATSTADLAGKLVILERRLAEGKERALPGKGVFLSTDLCPAPGRTVFVFPGEGSQYPDMLRELCLHFPVCRSAFDDADTACALAGCTTLPSKWIFPTGAPSDAEPDEDGLGIAGAVQAVLAANTAFYRFFTQLGISPDAVAGVGVGEINAFECAGVFGFDSRLARLQALRDGYRLLTAVADHPKTPRCVCLSSDGLPLEALRACLAPHGDQAVIAREHSANLFGLSVRPAAAEAVMRDLKEAGATVRVLPLVQPYHTPWMEPVKPELAAFFGKLIRQSATVPVYSCMLAAPHEGPPAAWVDHAASQWTRPLRFADTIRRLHDDGFRVFVELGARGSLTASIDAILHHRPHVALAANRGHRSDIQQMHTTLAALAAHGQRIDIAQLHRNRGSRLVDLERPRPTHAHRAERMLPVGTALPSLRAAEIPDGLVAPQAPAPVGLRPPADLATRQAPDGLTDFPLLLDAERVEEHPGDYIALAVDLSIFDQPFLADSTLGSSQVSLADSTLRGLPLMPLGMLAELMAEAARQLAPEQVVVGIEQFTAPTRLTVEGSTRSVRVSARRLPQTAAGACRIQASVHDRGDPAGEANEPQPLMAQAIILLADHYPRPAAAPRTLALRGPVKLDWRGADLYPTRLHHGPSFQNIHAIPGWGENGLVAHCVALPRGNLLRRTTTPRFSIDPVLLGAVGATLAAWDAREPCSGDLQLPVGFDAAVFHAAPGPEWNRGTLNLFVNAREPQRATADAEVADDEGRPLLAVTGWTNRIYPVGPALHHLVLHPDEGFLTTEIPRKLLPSLSQEVICCIADALPPALVTEQDDFWLRVTAYLTLSLTERLKWREMGGSPHRRREWLLGRIAAKDCVRHCLRTRYGRKWAAADIRIETDEAGKPCPQGEWRRHCGARMDISITHTTEHIVAAVAPNACLGIDIERRDRSISDDFAAAAFGAAEQELAAESGEGATALFRFWCAKEALVKALGTGLRYGASDLLVRAYDRQTGRLTVEATRLWAQAFPVLRNLPIPVHSCLLDNLVLAVCVLDAALVGETRAASPAF